MIEGFSLEEGLIGGEGLGVRGIRATCDLPLMIDPLIRKKISSRNGVIVKSLAASPPAPLPRKLTH